MLRVALVGATATGKTRLATELATHLNALGVHAVVASDVDGRGAAATPTASAPAVVLFDVDHQAWIETIAAQRTTGLTLLMGLDLPTPDGDRAAQEQADGRLRGELQAAGIGFQTIYGQGPQRVRSALGAVGMALGRSLLPDDAQLREGNGQWQCDACSDPDCEHRLFSALLAGRSASR